MDERLASLLVDLSELSDEQAEELVFKRYGELYLDRGPEPRRMGVRKAHDGTDVVFTESRYVHAFGKPRERTTRQYAKDELDRLRGERVAWIGPIIAGEVKCTECWVIPPKNGGRDVRDRPPNRLYLVREERYVVWLEPSSKSEDWWFSSAYVVGQGDIRRYCRAGRQIWVHEKSRD